ncbi:MAG: 1,4-alpha-glucan branching protein GlgB [Clostridia bacterium]|nr:1,4-alpha-glucan branching protein GlgB [Clostridia bacterium]
MDSSTYRYLFHQGTLYNAYEYLGCVWGEKTAFRVYAPAAHAVSVIGEFNGWQEEPLTLIENGIWELVRSGVNKGDEYKYVIYCAAGRLIKSDPYAKQTNTREFTNSIVSSHDFEWTDGAYLRSRNRKNRWTAPMNIYEAHIGSWKKGFSYRQFADEIAPYLVEMGFTHIELMGISEHPLDESWGYQVTGYFSPTRRYGSNHDFAYLVNKLHSCGIGVILDWVPAHFPKNAEALYRFDGTALFEKEGFMGEHKEWGTCCFDYAKPEVRSFLISSAIMWIRQYHIDGLRVDAVSSMLYLDYGRTEWTPNEYGGNENIQAIEFLRQLNYAVHKYTGAFTVAEESTAWPNVTKDEGLGFDFKWNMGWMHDTLEYLSTDSLFRQYKHDKMTFSLTYAFSENFVLPISHDEVVYGKGSLLSKAAGEYGHKFGAVRAYLTMMYAHPGKKLLFMGSELGQFDEWNAGAELGWNLLDYPAHRELKEYVKKLSRIYCKYKPLYMDDSWGGFEWKVVDDRSRNVFAVERKWQDQSVIVAVNFSPVPREVDIACEKRRYRVLLSSALLDEKCDSVPTEFGRKIRLGGYGTVVLYSKAPQKSKIIEIRK